MENIRILAVDDHEVTMVGYRTILEKNNLDYTIDMEIVNTYQKGKQRIEISAHTEPYDVLFLDIQLFPPQQESEEGRTRTGEDLGILARKLVPDTKIVFISSFSDNYRINSICQSVNPEGYWVKSDITGHNLATALKKVMSEPPFYSATALSAVRRKMSSNIELDRKDKKILYHLSIGTKNKDLEKYIGLSTSAIENRKRQLKVAFGTENENDLALIHAARTKGFL